MLRLAALFSAHMVLQSGQPLPIWGWSDPGDKVTVSLAGQTAEAVAGQDGRWQAKLKPLAAGGPFVLEVKGKQSLKVEDVLVGEVWLCSGQSNMALNFSESDRFKEDSPSFDDAQMRLFSVPNRAEDEPIADVKSEWRLLTPESAHNFSAVALYFGRKLRKELKVPVGLVASHWGGSIIETWTSMPRLKADPANKKYFEWAEKEKPKLPSGLFGIHVRNVRWSGKSPKPLPFPEPQLWVDSLSEAAMDNSAEAGSLGFSGRLGVGGWAELHQDLRQGGKAFDARAYDGVEFEAKGNGRLNVTFNHAKLGDWGFNLGPDLQLSSDWKTYQVKFNDCVWPWGSNWPAPAEALENVAFVRGDLGFPAQPAVLYNGMIAPLIPYAMRGVCWYQGESNAERSMHYATQLPDMIKDWRQNFANPSLAFMLVQIANHGPHPKEPGDSTWAGIREAELKALSLPQTGLASAVDIGDEKDIHPKNKRDVGQRLALQALDKCYAKKLSPGSPLYRSAEFKDGQAILSFDCDGSKLVSKDGGELKGFAIAGLDQHFVWASAKIDGDKVLVSAPSVKDPKAVRYAWADNPDCNLANTEGLPASPFRTDSWEIKDKDW